MVCYQEHDRIVIRDKQDLETFARENKVFDAKKPIVDGRFELNVSNIRKICAKLPDSDYVVFKEKGYSIKNGLGHVIAQEHDYYVIMEIGY